MLGPVTKTGFKKLIFISVTVINVVQSVFLPGFAINDVQMSVSPVGKGKAIPLQSLTGPEGSTRLRLPDFKTIGT
jgi:hypothetical protein